MQKVKPPLVPTESPITVPVQVPDSLSPGFGKYTLEKQQRIVRELAFLLPAWETRMALLALGFSLA